MESHNNNNAFKSRMIACIDRVGGKRAMANAAAISESQLFRYLSGASILPSDRMLAMAKAARVDMTWLLTGEGPMEGGNPELRPGFRAELMIQVAQSFEELLIESDKKFTPRQRAVAITLIYESLRLEEYKKAEEVAIDKRMTPFYPDYLAPLRSDSRMEDYLAIMNALEYGMDVSAQSLKLFDSFVKMGLTSAYEGSMGEIYFDKMGNVLLPAAAKNLLDLVEKTVKLTGKTNLDWLDAGCGNGRHLSFLNAHCPQLKLYGFDISKLALNLCEKLVLSGKLPIGTVQEADLRNIPHPNESMDVIYCRAGLHTMPYLPDTDVGAVQFMIEAARVLRPKGILHILTPSGVGRDYVNFIQYHSADTLKLLARAAKLKVVSLQPAPMNETGGSAGKDYSNKLNQGWQVILQKAE